MLALHALMFLSLAAGASLAAAATITVTSNTRWSALSGGSGPGGLPGSADTIVVKRNRTLTVDVADAVAGSIQLGSDASPQRGRGTLSFDASSKLVVSGTLTLGEASEAGSVDMSDGGTLVLQRFSHVSGSFSPGTGTVELTATSTLPGVAAFGRFNNLTINGTGATVSPSQDTTVDGTLRLSNGTLAVGSHTLSLNGPAIAGTPANLATTPASRLSFGGSSGGVAMPQSVTQLAGLTVDNSKGIALSRSLAVSGALTLTNGAVTTGSHVLSTTGTCSKVSATNGYVIGYLRLTFATGSSACTYPVGSNTGAAPVVLTLNSGGGTLTAWTTGNEHPGIAGSGIDPARNANRYWSLGASGDTAAATTTSYSAAFHFNHADLDAAATATSFIAAIDNAGTWSRPSPVTAASASLTLASVPGPISLPADFAIGQLTDPPCTVPADLGATSGVNCVCDNFGRSSVNPSTISGGNWALTTSSGSFGVPRIVNPGYLRLTGNTVEVATAATLPGTFPAAGNLVAFDFRHYAYCGSNPQSGCGADGIALTLSDAGKTPTPGAFGGSLGYAQKINISGFNGGWMGVGIDEYGNFQTRAEGRGSGSGTEPVRDSVSVRGSGSGDAETAANYPYLAGTGTLSPGIDDPDTPSAAHGHAYRIAVDARCYKRDTNTPGELVCNNPLLERRARVTLYRDTTGQGNFGVSNKVLDFDAYAVNSLQADVPAAWKASFTGSTGSVVNIHEIRALRVCAAAISRPPAIAVDDYSPSTCSTAANGRTTVTVTGLRSDGSIDTAYARTVTLSATLAGGGLSKAAWLRKGAQGVLRTAGPLASYVFSAEDNGVATFYLSDTTQQDVIVTVNDTAANTSSSTSSPIRFRGSSFIITANNDPLASEVVAGRGHMITVTRASGCGTDSAYTGTKNLDGWYTPDAAHPAGAHAPQVCTLNGDNTCTPGAGSSCQSLSIAAPTVSSSSNNLPALLFDNGTAKFCLVTSDVGKFALSVRDDVASASSPITGTTAVLTARPFAVAVSGIAAGPASNPATTSPGDPYFTRAGRRFSATVGAYLWSSDGDRDGDGLPDADRGHGDITARGLAPRYADTVALSASQPYGGNGSAPALGALDNGTISVSAGSGTGNLLSYAEVGGFSLVAAPASNYLGSGIDLRKRVVYFARPLDPAQSRIVGRFIPDRFAVAGGSVRPACAAGGFTYVGQPFSVDFQLIAQNAQGSTTTNYSGSFARLDVSGFSSFNFGAVDGSQILTSRLGHALQTPSGNFNDGGWNAGVAAVSGKIRLNRGESPDAPMNAFTLGAAPMDADGVTLPASALGLDTDGNNVPDKALLDNTSTVLRFGRLRLSNAHGSELLNLPIPAVIEYWNGTDFVANAEDHCSRFGAASVGLSGHDGGINSVNMKPSNVHVGNGEFLAGINNEFRLNKPSPTPLSKGRVALCVRLGTETAACPAVQSAEMPWLQGKWRPGSVGYLDDPESRATFGIHGGAPFIFSRERY